MYLHYKKEENNFKNKYKKYKANLILNKLK